MCGIVAIFSPDKTINRERLQAATAVLKHRGPDEQRIWISPNGHVGLGHTRLSIVSDGAQPIAGENEQVCLTVNGEFYDYDAIRRQLVDQGHHFRTETDSEIALHLYQEMGVACLPHLRGEFAFLLWDDRQQALWAVRDRFGIKPLFYARVGSVWYLASEVKALLSAGVPAAWDQQAVFQQIFGCYHNDRSLFSGIHQVPPGHHLQITANGHRLVRYWDVNFPRRKQKNGPSLAENQQQVKALLEESVRLRLQGDWPVGCLLSGGLDSSAVLGMSVAHTTRPITAFTIAFDRAAYDETAQARRTAKHLGVDLQVISAHDAVLADHFAQAAWHGEMVQYNAHGSARFLLSKAIHDAGYRTVMAGEGADELFAGYGFLQTALGSGDNSNRQTAVWLQRALRLFSPLNETQRQIAGTSPLLARASHLLALPPRLINQFAQAMELLRSILRPDFLGQFAGHDPYRHFITHLDWRGQILGRERAKQLIYIWLRSIFAGYHMAADRLDMAHSVEVRLPFLDHHLFEYASQIPIDRLAPDGQRKHLLRQAVRSFVTEETYRGPKQPFYAPPSALRRNGHMHQLTQDTLRSTAMAVSPFFDQTRLIVLLDQYTNTTSEAPALLDPLLMMILSLCFIQEKFGLSH